MFKVGDKVKILEPCNGIDNFSTIKNSIVTLINYEGKVTAPDLNGNPACSCGNYWELVKESESSNINNLMSNLSEKFIQAITPEPQRSFRKAGITNGDNLITEEGQKIFMTWLLSKNQNDFKKEVVDDLLKEKE